MTFDFVCGGANDQFSVGIVYYTKICVLII